MTSVKMGALDMMRADSRIITALGPIDAGTIDEIVARVRTLAACGGADGRFGLIPSTDSRTWRHDPDAFLHEIVRLRPCTADELPEVLTRRARAACRSAALSIAIAGQYLIIDMSHGLGDARLATTINQIVGERLAPQRFAYRTTAPAHPMRTAIARFYGRHPARLRALVRSRAETAEHRTPWTMGGDVKLVAWRRAPVVVAARSGRATAAQLRSRQNLLRTRVSTASLIFASLAGEIRSHGIDLADTVTVMFDCRRYLAATSRVFGNFVSGVDLNVSDPADPVAVHSAVTAAAASGRPLAALALGSYTFDRRYRRGQAYDAPQCVPVSPRAKLVFSDIGDVFADSPMWKGERRDRFFNALNEPADPETIVFTITHRGPDVDITATFHGNVFSADLVQSALNNVVGAPHHALLGMTGS